MRFLFAGDLVINQSYSSKKIDSDVVRLFENSDCNIINLEAPVTSCQKKIIKTGPHLKAHKASTLDVLTALNIHVAALANNHIKDYGEQGVIDTIFFCQENNIRYVGAGENAQDAAQTMILETPEGTIAIINIAENEWASAESQSAGANGMCFIKDTKKIQQAKQEHDFVFVVVHGGHEYYNLPSPRMQNQYRFYAEQGADLVVGHHTHCISGYEVHKGTPIFYSLGNFLFTKNKPHTDWYTGIVLQVDINNKKLSTQLRPIQQSRDSFELRFSEDNRQVLARVKEYSEVIRHQDKLQGAWLQLVSQRRNSYLRYWSAKMFINNRYMLALINRLGLKLTSVRILSYFLNLMRCEAHSDLSREIIKESLKS